MKENILKPYQNSPNLPETTRPINYTERWHVSPKNHKKVKARNVQFDFLTQDIGGISHCSAKAFDHG